ncbi:protein SPO16 homolog [Engraulis encrasicolus]|uniref:protein SPO16 homolog n=1 Tax=Engraulis encrasicolus TaxID=184585 RepID=UPI002FD144B2
MADQQKSNTDSWQTTVIVSTSLQSHESVRLLQAHRVRFSEGVESGSFVFPLSGTAFMLVVSQDLPEPLEDSGLYEKIQRFVKVHRNCFLLLQAPVFGQREWAIMEAVQSRFFGSNLRAYPVHCNANMVKGMLALAKATSKPNVDTVRDRMSLVRGHLIERSPVWELLRDIQNQMMAVSTGGWTQGV